MRLIYAMLLGFILDLIFGDPHGLIHPVQIIGWFIDKLKKGMQHMIYGCSYEEVREKEIERKAGVEKTAGFFLMLFIVAGTFAVVYGILYVANLIHPVLRFCLETFFIYQIFATKSLKTLTKTQSLALQDRTNVSKQSRLPARIRRTSTESTRKTSDGRIGHSTETGLEQKEKDCKLKRSRSWLLNSLLLHLYKTKVGYKNLYATTLSE